MQTSEIPTNKVEHSQRADDQLVTNKTFIRYHNSTLPKKASSIDPLTDAKQNCVGDYSCCSHIP